LYQKEMPKKVNGIIDRTILGIINFLKETVSHEEIASRKGFLQSSDPRLKCLSIVLLLLSVLSSKNPLELVAIYCGTLTLTLCSSITLGFFLKRTLLFIPLFSLFIVIPAIFSPVTPGDSILDLVLGTHTVSITRQGIDSALIFFLRVLDSVSLTVLLVISTRHHVLLKVLRIFKIPALFVMTLSMTYRYIYLLLEIVQNTFIAIKSRVGYASNTKTGRRIIGANMASLWLKSYRLQTQVYNAMLSRGYTGEPRVLDEFNAHTFDYFMLIGAITVFIGTLWLNYFTY
jgi:cobalt/nickel transport system permease protein